MCLTYNEELLAWFSAQRSVYTEQDHKNKSAERRTSALAY